MNTRKPKDTEPIKDHITGKFTTYNDKRVHLIYGIMMGIIKQVAPIRIFQPNKVLNKSNKLVNNRGISLSFTPAVSLKRYTDREHDSWFYTRGWTRYVVINGTMDKYWTQHHYSTEMCIATSFYTPLSLSQFYKLEVGYVEEFDKTGKKKYGFKITLSSKTYSSGNKNNIPYVQITSNTSQVFPRLDMINRGYSITIDAIESKTWTVQQIRDYLMTNFRHKVKNVLAII